MTFFILPRAPRVTRRLTARLLASTAMAGALAACGGDAEANGLPAVPASAVTVTVSAIESGPMHEPVQIQHIHPRETKFLWPSRSAG